MPPFKFTPTALQLQILHSMPTIFPITKESCISLLRTCKSMAELKQIHCQILTSNLSPRRGILNHLLLLCTHPHAGDLRYASALLSDAECPSLFARNLMIKALYKKGRFKCVFKLYNRMREDGLSPDNFTYPFVLKAAGGLRALVTAREVHAHVLKSGLGFDSYVQSSLIGVYAEMGCIQDSRSLFDEMPERDVVHWNAMITGLVKGKEYAEAISTFETMKDEDVKPDEATLVSTLSACVQTGDLDLGKRIRRYVNEEFRSSIPVGNVVLDLYVKCGCLETARSFFDGMPAKNVISWTTMLTGYLNSGCLDEARALFDSSPARDVVLWTAMINGYVQQSRFEDALSLFGEMPIKRIKLDNFTVVTLLTACANLGALEQGEWIHGYIKSNEIDTNTVVSTALIDMYFKCGCVDKSMEVFGNVRGRKDAKTWTSTICGLAKNGQAVRALALFSEMTRAGVKPDDVTFISVLTACSHGGLTEEGRRHFHMMKEVYGIEPRSEHYACLIDILGRGGRLEEAEELIEGMPDGDAMPLWGALLGACRTHGDVEMNERLARRVVKHQESGNSGVYTSIANAYAAAGRWEDVKRVRRKMSDLGIKKVPGWSSVEVNGANGGYFPELPASGDSCPELCTASDSVKR